MTIGPAVSFAGQGFLAGSPLFGPLELRLGGGEWTCLLGPSGVGKSTVLRLIAGLPTGADFVGEIVAMDRQPLAGRVAYMAQSDLLFPWLDVLGNVTLGASLRAEPAERERAQALIERVGLGPRLRQRPGTLSGGERQRAALARTLMEDRPVVLLDEPFSALDARTRAEMQEMAAELLAGRTVLLVTHDPAEAARLGHRVWVMAEHALTEAPPPASAPVRAFDDAETLACQARLLAMLRQTA